MRFAVMLAMMALAVWVETASAEVYKYTDSKGEIHFVDDIAKVPKKYRKQALNPQPLADISVVDATPSPKKQADAPPPPRQSGAQVELFMTSWCGYCKKMVQFLNEKGIPYTAYDIEKDSAAARTYRELGGRGVPVVRIGSHVVQGFSPDAVVAYYNGRR